jgi:hypothetical protein
MTPENQGMNDSKEILPGDYTALLASVKERVRSAQYAALKAVNTELVGLYWRGSSNERTDSQSLYTY